MYFVAGFEPTLLRYQCNFIERIAVYIVFTIHYFLRATVTPYEIQNGGPYGNRTRLFRVTI